MREQGTETGIFALDLINRWKSDAKLRERYNDDFGAYATDEENKFNVRIEAETIWEKEQSTRDEFKNFDVFLAFKLNEYETAGLVTTNDSIK